jgi:hypothetical protein
MEEMFGGLIWGYIPAFASKDWKNRENYESDGRSPGRHLKLGSLEYEVWEVTNGAANLNIYHVEKYVM